MSELMPYPVAPDATVKDSLTVQTEGKRKLWRNIKDSVVKDSLTTAAELDAVEFDAWETDRWLGVEG